MTKKVAVTKKALASKKTVKGTQKKVVVAKAKGTQRVSNDKAVQAAMGMITEKAQPIDSKTALPLVKKANSILPLLLTPAPGKTPLGHKTCAVNSHVDMWLLKAAKSKGKVPVTDLYQACFTAVTTTSLCADKTPHEQMLYTFTRIISHLYGFDVNSNKWLKNLKNRMTSAGYGIQAMKTISTGLKGLALEARAHAMADQKTVKAFYDGVKAGQICPETWQPIDSAGKV